MNPKFLLAHAVSLTSIGNLVPGCQEFLVALIETIVGLVKKYEVLLGAWCGND
jgi:hypothetical protein